MRRGFKAEAERLSADARKSLGLEAFDPLDPWRHADQIGVVVLAWDTLDLTDQTKHQLLVADSASWSGMTIKEGGTTAIIINPAHARARQISTLMHELSHIMLRHVPASVQVSKTGVMLLSDFSPEQEDEADWLAAAMLLPRDALVFHRSRGRDVGSICSLYGISEDLCNWRLRMTGVELQLRRAGHR